jgi:hypothetical protein
MLNREEVIVSERKTSYFSYLLRFWRKTVEGEVVWQGSLQSSPTSEPLGFATPDALFNFLRGLMQTQADPPGQSPLPSLSPTGSDEIANRESENPDEVYP